MEGFRSKLIYTAVIYFLFLQLALRFGIVGPTLSDLKENLGVDTNNISRSVSVMCAGICCGAILSGILCRWIARELLAFILVLGTSLLVASIAFLESYGLFLFWNFAVGFTSGAAICLCEAWILDIWGENCGPWMQALQFFRGLGYIIAPLLAEPFLSVKEEDEDEEGKKPFSTTLLPNSLLITLLPITTPAPLEVNTRIRTPYILNAVMLAVGAAFLLCLYIFKLVNDRRNPKGSSSLGTGISQVEIISSVSMSSVMTSSSDLKEVVMVSTSGKNSKAEDQGAAVVVSGRARYFGLLIVLLSCIFYLFFYEEVIVIFLPTFAVNVDVHLSKSQASLLTTAFSLSNVVGKAISVLLALKVSHIVILYGNLLIMIVSLVVVIIFGNSSVPSSGWASVCMVSFRVGLSSVIASLYTLMESAIEMSPLVCGCLNFTGTIGSIVIPLVIGHHLDSFPMALIFASLACAVVCLTLYVTIHVLLMNKNALIAVPVVQQSSAVISNGGGQQQQQQEKKGSFSAHQEEKRRRGGGG
ncbi:hypothetical protein TYRP_015548 [Tyrophagus putrescentiae]|nr:hypothetical protein TYRP_015548 [Tyrophagus putrescentiae]